MRTSPIVILLFAGLAISSVAQSPPPPPTPTIGTEQEQNLSSIKKDKPENAQSVASASSPILNQTQSPQTEKNKQADTNPNHANSSAKWWSIFNVVALTVFNGLLVIVGFAQVKSMNKQATYMQVGLAETKRAADAAKESADVATKAVSLSRVTERAIVLIDTVALNTDRLQDSSIVLFTLKNFGRTIADSVQLTGKLEGIGQDPLEVTPPKTIAPQGTAEWMSRSVIYWISHDHIAKINQRAMPLGYKIDVTYVDAFQERHNYHCEGRYEPVLRRFTITNSTSD